MSLKATIESLLFLIDEPIGAQEIAQRVNADANDVRQALSQLIQEYEMRETGLMINTMDGYILGVKPEYDNLVEEFLPISIKAGCIRTLSAIALKEPVHQSEVVKMRGGGAYEQIKELIEMELIIRKKEGHSFTLRTTKLFHDYFKLSDAGIELQDFLKGKSRKYKTVASKEEGQETLDLESVSEENSQTAENSETKVEEPSLESSEEAIMADSETSVENTNQEEISTVEANESTSEVQEASETETPVQVEDELNQVANELAQEVKEERTQTENETVITEGQEPAAVQNEETESQNNNNNEQVKTEDTENKEKSFFFF